MYQYLLPIAVALGFLQGCTASTVGRVVAATPTDLGFELAPEPYSRGPEVAAMAAYLEARLLVDRRQIPVALEKLRQAMAHGRDIDILAFEAGRLAAQAGRFLEAETFLQQALDRREAFPEAWLLLGRLQLEAFRRPERAVVCFQMLDRYEGQAVEAEYRLALTAVLQDNTDGALTYLQRALAANPVHLHALNLAGELHFRRGDLPAARLFLERALSLQPSAFETLWFLAQVEEGAQEWAKALILYRRLCDLNRDNFHLVRKLGDVYLQLGDRERALAEYRKARERLGNEPGLLVSLGRYHLQAGELRPAERYLTAVLERDPDSGLVRYLLSRVYEKLGDVQQAIEIMIPISVKDDLFVEYVLRRAALMFRHGEDNAAALRWIDDMAEMMPDKVPLIRFRAELHELAGAREDALRVLEHGLELNGEDAGLLFHLGALYDRDGDKNKAIVYLRRSLLHEPDDPEVLNYLGYTFVELGRELGEARRLLERAVELRPEDGNIVDSIGWLHHRLGDQDKALEFLRKAHALLPEEPVISEHLGEVLLLLGRREEARQLLQQAVNLHGTKNADEAGRLRRRLDQLDEP